MVPLRIVWTEKPQDPASWGTEPVLHGIVIHGEISKPKKIWIRSTAMERQSQEELVSVRFYFSCKDPDLHQYLFETLPARGGGLFVSFDNETTWIRVDGQSGSSPETALRMLKSAVSLLAVEDGRLRPGDLATIVFQLRKPRSRDDSRVAVQMHCLFDCI